MPGLQGHRAQHRVDRAPVRPAQAVRRDRPPHAARREDLPSRHQEEGTVMGKRTKAEVKAGRAALKKARAALEREGNRTREETPEFRRLNRAVIRAEQNVPWWAR